MNISGLNKFSLIDYPGEICCIVFTPGCNFRCGYCHNSEFVLPEKIKNIEILKEKLFFNFLEKRKGLLTAVSICGGEPSLQKDLLEFCRKIKNMGFLVKLDTNGRDSELIQKLIDEKIIDYIAMDIKEDFENFGKLSKSKESSKKYLESINIIIDSDIDYEFRTTVIKGFHNLKIIENIVKIINGANNYFIQNYRQGNTLEKDFEGNSFSENELGKFKIMASKYIKKVGIRS